MNERHRNRGFCLLLLLAAGVLLSAPGAADPPRRLAVLIGIDRYKAVNSLAGCVNDVEAMRALLVGKFGFEPSDIRTLTNGQATRAGILDALARLVERTRKGDIVVVHYSGHGSRMKDVSGDEADGWDETIVPQDSRQGDVFDISDDEINEVLETLGKKTPNVTFIFDSCHSGTVSRAGTTVRLVADDHREPPRAPAGVGSPVLKASQTIRPANAPYVLISGCRADELSNESELDGQRHGALTWALVKNLLRRGGAETYRDLMDAVGMDVTGRFPSQHPQLEGTRRDAHVFGVDETASDPYFLASPSGTQVALEAGEVLGVSKGARLDVFPPGTKSFADARQAVAQVEVVSADPFHAQARVVAGGPVAPASRAVLVEAKLGATPLRVFLAKPLTPALRRVRDRLGSIAFVRTVDAEAQAQLLVREERGLVLLEAADLEPLSPGVRTKDTDAVEHIVSQLTEWAQWFNVLSLANASSPFSIGLSIAGGTPSHAISEVEDGQSVALTVENRSDRELYLTILDLNTTGAIDVLYPPPGAEEKIAARASVTKSLEMFVPEGRRTVRDVFKVLATTSPIDPGTFARGTIKAVGPAAADPLVDFLERSVKGKSRNSRPSIRDGWATASVAVRVRGRDQRGDAFVLHYEGARGDLLPEARSRVPKCAGAAPGAVCWEVSPFGSDASAVLVRAGGSRAAEKEARSLGSIWDEAYRLQKETGASRVEPVLEWEETEANREPVAGARDALLDVPDKPAALANNRWSLEMVRVDEAWALLRQRGRASGEEAAEIVVAHPDTGYRPHAEIWDADETRSAVHWRHGYDYVDGKDDAQDPLDTSGPLANPGHGTKSSSVIVSPKGKQLAGAGTNQFVDGVAPGARTVPLRVHRSVVLFSPSRLAMAISDAAGDDRTRVKEAPQLVSISMGGLPSWSLWKAVRRAEERGLLVVSAAGNKVGFVVWPARFKETIAVAATNVECTPWVGSSHGAAVDISAPGETVWMADVAADGTTAIGRGQGTTYATATTAGVAALWMSYHRGEAAFEELRRTGRLTRAFRQVVQSTAWRPDAVPGGAPPGVACQAGIPWNPRQYGPGILDAARVLAAPLPDVPASRDVEEPRFSDLPLFASLFAAGTPNDVVRARYARLLGVVRSDEGASLEAEILTWYAAEPEVRAALDPIASAGEPEADAYRRARAALEGRAVSETLRAALRAGGGGGS